MMYPGRLLISAALLAGTGAPCAQTTAAGAAPNPLSRGEYLSRIGGCAGCHTAPSGGTPFAGGRGVPSPLGTIFSTNITPDPDHGIGRYDFEDFRLAVRRGTAKGGKHLYPAMPYTAYAKMNDGDLRALYDYLMQVAPSASVPPKNKLPFPINQRWALRFWKWAFLPRDGYVQRSGLSAEWNRGAYLVQSLGHCGACHTPRGAAFEERGYDETSEKFLTGQVNDHWYASNLTGDPGSGLGRVDAKTLAQFLRTGHGQGMAAFGPMGEEVEQSLQYLTAGDAGAISSYLKTLPARNRSGVFQPSGKTVRTPMEGNHAGDLESTGAAVYRSFCAQCHQPDGQGKPGVFPRLAGNPVLLSDDASSVIRIVLEGARSPQTAVGPRPQAMPGFMGTLTDVQIAQALTYTREAWGNYARPVSTNDVSTLHRGLRK
jgi:mono/diheme cytochrome c family protein